nr:cell wall-binding repeat-containing protein [Quadrisphaera sp. RL12-1S]
MTRYQGGNRVLTAVTTSRQLFPDTGSARAVVVASSTSYADSLAGARLAAAVGAPLLLTDPLALNPEVAAEVARVLAVPAAPSTSPVALAAADASATAVKPTATGTVYLLGGTTAVSAATETALRAVSTKYTVTRLSGADRYETAVKIAAQTAVDDPVPGAPVYVASGADYPDGLAVAALASRTGGVVLLTQGSTMPAATLGYLQTYDPNSELLVAVGGPAAAATAGHGGDRAIVGTDRYDTARLVAARFTAQPGAPRVDDVGLATGTNWPDALAGAAAMGNLRGPLLLTRPDSLSPAVAPALRALSTAGRPTSALVFGGPSVVSPGAADAFAAVVAG